MNQLVLGAVAISAAAALGSAVGCAGGNDPPAVCSTTQAWTQGDDESPLMHPGAACISCHQSGEGPRFQIAGTVMNASNDDDNCYGVAGAQVVVVDANGQQLTLTTNDAGNFYSDERTANLAFPFSAKVVMSGRERAMTAHQSSGDCNACHTAAGNSGAPGRILAP